MSESKEAPKKKKKKLPLPVIIAVVAIAGGGGYFMMGKKGGTKKPAVETKMILGETIDLGEFITPLSDGKTFMDAEIEVKLDEKGHLGDEAAGGGEGGGKTAPDPLARNAVLSVLKTTSPDLIKTPEGMEELKEHIAWQINHDINKLKKFSKKGQEEEAAAAAEKEKADKDSDKDADKKDKDKAPDKAPDADSDVFKPIAPKDRKYPDLDSDDGPVHLVLFSKFLPIEY